MGNGALLAIKLCGMIYCMRKMRKGEDPMENGYEKRGYLSEDFRLFHLKDDRYL